MTFIMPAPKKRNRAHQEHEIIRLFGSDGKVYRFLFQHYADMRNVQDSIEMRDGGVYWQSFDSQGKISNVFFPLSIAAPNPETRLYETEAHRSMGIYTREDAWVEVPEAN